MIARARPAPRRSLHLEATRPPVWRLLVLWSLLAAMAVPAAEGRSAQGGIAGERDTAVAAIWPPAATPAALRESRLLLESLLAQAGGSVSSPVFLPLEGGLAVGAAMPGASSSEVRALAQNLLRPPPVGERLRLAAVATLEDRRRADAADPVAEGRALLLGQLYPAQPGEWWLAGGEQEWSRISTETLDRLAERVRQATPRLRVSGPAALVDRVATLAPAGSPPADGEQVAGLARDRLIDPEPVGAPRTGGETPASDTVDRLGALVLRSDTGGEAAVLVGLAFNADLARRHPAALPLIAELLRAGEGSLEQRLGVAVGAGADSYVELLPSAAGGGTLLLGVRAGPEDLASAWRLLEGALASIAAQPFRSDAVLRARQRLDRAASGGLLPGDRLRSELLPPAWNWPPEDRWKRPPGPAAVREAAAELMSGARRAQCLVYSVGAEPASLPAVFAGAAVLEAGGYCPDRPDLSCGGAGAPPAAPGLVAELLHSLAGEGLVGPAPSFRANYRVEEHTPVGPAFAELRVVVDGAEVHSSWRPGGHTLRLSSAAAGDSARVDAADETELPAAALDALELLVLREPVILVAAARAGTLPAQEREVACPAGRCPSLTVELAQGTRLALVLDPGTHLPREARIWWPGSAADASPDAALRYSRWREASGVRVAGRVAASGDLGDRVFELLSWELIPAEPAPSPP